MEKSSYYALSAKAHAMYGKRLTAENYRDLMRCSSVEDVASYLKTNTEYGKYLDALPEGNVHRGQIESYLRRSLMQRFEKLYRYDRKDGLFTYYIMEQEIRAIISCVDAIISKDIRPMIASLPLFVKKHTSISLDALGKVRTEEDLGAVLKKSRYAKIWERAVQTGTLRPVYLEQQLRDFYYSELLKYAKTIKGKGKKLSQMIKNEINVYNYTVSYRLKAFFGYDSQQIIPYLLSSAGDKEIAKLEKILKSCTKEEMAAQFLKSYCKDEEVESEYIEGPATRAAYQQSRHELAFSSSPSVTLYSYMQMARTEVEDIITIIEGIRYGVPMEQLHPLLFTTEAR